MRSFTINALGPFDLGAAVAFLDRFPGGSHARTAAGDLVLAFVADRSWTPVGVELDQRRSAINGRCWGEVQAEDVRRQVQRFLSLDVDGRGFPAVAAADPVVGGLVARFPGLRPVRFRSPYEAAVWGVLASGIPVATARATWARLLEALGHPMTVSGKELLAFPAPTRLVDVADLPALEDGRRQRLRAVAEAALDGLLEADRLRDLPTEQALAELHHISALDDAACELVLVRGVGNPDAPPRPDQHLLSAVATAYGMPAPPTPAEFARITEGWRPYRSWVSFLLRVAVDTWNLPT